MVTAVQTTGLNVQDITKGVYTSTKEKRACNSNLNSNIMSLNTVALLGNRGKLCVKLWI